MSANNFLAYFRAKWRLLFIHTMLCKYGKKTGVIFGAFLFLVSSNLLYFGSVCNKTIIPFAVVGYEIGYSQLGPKDLVGYLPSHTQRALME